ncbi:MAG: DUF1349 domain-containing protein, partial [Planctomycetota bacterium]
VEPWPFNKKKDQKPKAKLSKEAKKKLSQRWEQDGVETIVDDFSDAKDILAAGVTKLNWSGLLGSQEGTTADRIEAADGQLWMQCSEGRYQEPWTPLGPFLYKSIQCDFRATVRVEEYESLSFNNCGIMARVGDLGEAGKGEDWISIDYFPLYSGVYARHANDGRRSEPGNSGQGKKADKYLQLEKAGDLFFLRHSPDGKNWAELDCSPIQRKDLEDVELQVGLFQSTYSKNQAQVSFDDFTLELLSDSKVAPLNVEEK